MVRVMQRWPSSARMATGVVLSLGLLLAACSGSHTGSSTTTRAPSSSAPSTSAPTGPAGGPVPTGFSPDSFTAISDARYWVLGTAPCAAGRCPALVRTTDGGSSFLAIPAPPLTPGASGQPTLRFADSLDGYAFVEHGPSSAFYSTHDGGSSWHAQALGDVLALAIGAGQVAVVTAQCGGSGCSAFALQRSHVASDSWSSGPLPFAPDGPAIDLEAHGQDLWLMGTPASANAPNSGVLARSTDAGATFVVGRSPCQPGLGGRLSPTSATNLWAVCPTGTEASAARSVDGGSTFATLSTPPMSNSASLGAASAEVAVLSPNDSTGTLLRTTDGGATLTAVTGLPGGVTFWEWIGFTDAQVGAALVESGSSPSPSNLALWRTTDAGAHWTPVTFG